MTLYIAAVIWAAGFSQVQAAAGLYAPLLLERYHATPASQMVVKDMAVAMPTLRGSSSGWRRQFSEVPSELRRAASEPSPTKPHRLDASLFPPGTRLVSAESVEAIFAGSGIPGELGELVRVRPSVQVQRLAGAFRWPGLRRSVERAGLPSGRVWWSLRRRWLRVAPAGYSQLTLANRKEDYQVDVLTGPGSGSSVVAEVRFGFDPFVSFSYMSPRKS